MSDVRTREEFADFVRANWTAMMRIAVAVSGSRTEGEDLVQSALTAAYPRWNQIRPEQALAYVRRSILNTHVSRWRRHRGAELVMPDPPEQASAAGTNTVEDRLALLPLVRDLPPRQRAVVVLRYLCDLSDTEIAETLGIATTTVRTQALRALASIRAAHPDPARHLILTTEELR
ncbi:MAG: SigE family RNA polymerase sigma factor [Jatrophihabitantaceae bacterium]